MTQLIKYHKPTSQILGELMSDFDSLLPRSSGTTLCKYRKIDLQDTGDKLVAEIEIPRFKKEEINLTIQDDFLMVSATKQQGSTNIGVRESVYLGRDIDTENVTAKLADGVLTVWLPKNERVKPRQIKIID